ncbi:MAG: hypothetical protein VX239_03570 [Candidatus Thermoplasmatota archaeon]|nr:hypothetical protein [Candidatus Thermoplasmatota archaeon]
MQRFEVQDKLPLLCHDLVQLAELRRRGQIDLDAPDVVLAVVAPQREGADLDLVMLSEQLRALSEVEVLHGPQLGWVDQPLLLRRADFALPPILRAQVADYVKPVRLVALQDVIYGGLCDVEGVC